jgi:hypothetical protein
MKNKTNNISFDFDDTLWTDEVEAYARELIEQGYVPWIVTARYQDNSKGYSVDNSPVYEVAKRLEIPRERIVFMNHKDKVGYFIENPDFLFHLDDSFFSVVYPMNENPNCHVPAIWYDPYISGWRGKISAYL